MTYAGNSLYTWELVLNPGLSDLQPGLLTTALSVFRGASVVLTPHSRARTVSILWKRLSARDGDWAEVHGQAPVCVC